MTSIKIVHFFWSVLLCSALFPYEYHLLLVTSFAHSGKQTIIVCTILETTARMRIHRILLLAHFNTYFFQQQKQSNAFIFFGWCITFLFSPLSSLFFYILGVLHSTCVLESEFGFIVNCNFKKSSLFRVRNLGGVKAHFGLGNFCVNEQTNHCQNDSYIRLTQN